MTLIGAPYLAHDAHGQLTLEGVNLQDLAQTHGTPLYVYAQSAMQSAAQAYLAALKGRDHLLCYAVKANSNLAVLDTFARMGLGFDIVSGGELARVLAVGADPSKIVFSGVGKSAEELQQALLADIGCFNVESEFELHDLSREAQRLGRRARVSLRVNPDVDAGTHPYISTGLKGNKFGIAHQEALAMYQLAQRLPGLEIVGIDCHIGSQITQIAPYVDALDRILDLVDALIQEGIDLHHIDFGGGLGIQYQDEVPPSAGDLVAALLRRMDERGHGHRRVMMEPGRSLVGNAGVLLTRVVGLKTGEQKNFCIVDAAMNDMMRPAMYEAHMAMIPVASSAAAPLTWDVVGPVCESGDWLAKDRCLAVQSGDTLAMLSAGAYGMTMASNYNTRPRAAEVMVKQGRAFVIRERERVTDLFAHEKTCPN